MPVARTNDALSLELQRLNAKRIEIDERIELVKRSEVARVQLLGYCKKNGVSRSDVLWVYGQLDAMRVTKAARLKRAGEHATKRKGVITTNRNLPKPELVSMGNKMAQARADKKLTLIAAADKSGLHPSVLSGYEKGKWKPGDVARQKLEKLYDINIKYPNDNGNGGK